MPKQFTGPKWIERYANNDDDQKTIHDADLSPADCRMIDRIAEETYDHLWAVLDDELGGMVAGYVATAASRAAVMALVAQLSVE